MRDGVYDITMCWTLYKFTKANRKKMTAGELKDPRLGMFNVLLAAGEKLRKVNQYQ